MIDSPATPFILGYLLLLVLIGIYSATNQHSSATFFLDDRTLGTLRIVGTMFSTFLGTGLVFTLASLGYLYGVGAFLLPGAAVLGFALFAWASPRLKELSDEHDAITLPGLFESHWRTRTRLLAAVVTVSLFAGTLSANFVVVGEILNALFGTSRRVGIVLFAGVVMLYTVLGGFRSVVRTDLLQMVVIVGTVVILLPALILLEGGVSALNSLPARHHDPLTLPGQIVVAYLCIGLFAFFGSQDLFQRVYAARTSTNARRGIVVFAGLLFVVNTVAVALGIFARAMVPEAPAEEAVVAVTSGIVSPEFLGVAALGFLSLANSDSDSQLLTGTSNVTQDFAPVIGVDRNDSDAIWFDRLTALGIGVVALLVALSVSNLLAIVNALGSWFAILGFVVVATLFWGKTTDSGAFAGLAVGFISATLFTVGTGEAQAATLVGLVPTVLTLGLVSVLTDWRAT